MENYSPQQVREIILIDRRLVSLADRLREYKPAGEDLELSRFPSEMYLFWKG